jgi:hypothetical protein
MSIDLKKICIQKAVQIGLAEGTATAEFTSFSQRLEENNLLFGCSDNSKIMTFVGILASGLSFHKTKDHVYLQVRRGTKDVLEGTASPDGMGVMAMKEGIVKAYSLPVLVYDYDAANVEVQEGQVVSHKSTVATSAGGTVVGGYMKVWLSNGEVIAPFFGLNDFDEWKSTSSNKANYSKKGFLKAKVKKHTFTWLSGAKGGMGVEDEEDVIDTTTGEVSTPYQATPAVETPHIAESNPEAPF